MAHFAKISEDNIVLAVVRFNDNDMLDENGNPSELVGQKYLEKHNNWPAHLWIQTSYNTFKGTHELNGTPFRGNYASIGYSWDPVNNIFLPPKPYFSWVLNVEQARWQSPIGDAPPENDSTKYYQWNEQTKTWDYLNYPEGITVDRKNIGKDKGGLSWLVHAAG